MRLTAQRTVLILVSAILTFCLTIPAFADPSQESSKSVVTDTSKAVVSDSSKRVAPAKSKPAAAATTLRGSKNTGAKTAVTKSAVNPGASRGAAPSDSIAANPPGKIHTLDEMVDIIKNSNLFYSVETLLVIQRNAFMGDTARPVLRGEQRIKMVNGVASLENYKLSSIGIPIMGMASGAFEDKNYPLAVTNYKRLLVTDPSFDPGYSYVGEAYMMLDSLDSAGVYLTMGTGKNFIDFTTHRLLGEVFWKSGNREAAIRELTLAHVLNVNDQKIRGQLEEWRLLAGRQWSPQSIVPKYQMHKVADTVFVKAPLDWIGYAMVKAVWKYEPGYAEKQLGYDPTGSAFVLMEEKEAVVGAMTTNRGFGFINPIVQQGYLDEFILYELVAPRYPMNIVILPKGLILRIADYVDKFR